MPFGVLRLDAAFRRGGLTPRLPVLSSAPLTRRRCIVAHASCVRVTRHLAALVSGLARFSCSAVLWLSTPASLLAAISDKPFVGLSPLHTNYQKPARTQQKSIRKIRFNISIWNAITCDSEKSELQRKPRRSTCPVLSASSRQSQTVRRNSPPSSHTLAHVHKCRGILPHLPEPDRNLHPSFELCASRFPHHPTPPGSSIQNRLPFPGSDSTPMLPPIRSAARLTIANPTPVPGNFSVVCRR
ncbi:MAG: hypothetical protein K0Q55_2509 [Verrucomicrobia bacterium]|nr:hypothetical protein [Verrucomicrobiota bacterium]